ncbi:MAG TPA: hypothetical protein VHX88_05105 [Solirubrobacteraceae bacterium]|jgi:predicted lipoprotein with Yx(FWY)xxD motif|nr:hypothetical protein [Solirubrobacteraceae bacterium]
MLVAGAFAVAGCGQATPIAPPSRPPASAADTPGAIVQVTTGRLSGIGTSLIDGHRDTLYAFTSDQDRKVTCTGGCAFVWRPLLVTPGQKVIASGGARRSLLGTDLNPAGGGRVVTYAGWPLYRFTGDIPGAAVGEQLPDEGGTWATMSVTGLPD